MSMGEVGEPPGRLTMSNGRNGFHKGSGHTGHHEPSVSEFKLEGHVTDCILFHTWMEGSARKHSPRS